MRLISYIFYVKIFWKIICGIIVIVCGFVSVFCYLPKISDTKVNSKDEICDILEIWQIDSFEGGIGSRQDFLMKTGIEFEKKNKKLLVSVTSHTTDSAYSSIQKGIIPDIISYGVGLDVGNIAYEISLRKGIINDKRKLYATPWCKGGYFLFSHTKEFDLSKSNLIVSKSENTNPLCAIVLNGYKSNNYSMDIPINAYTNFLSSKGSILLGTQRDVYRLRRREINFYCQYLKGFSDLYQYVSIVSKNENKRKISLEFIKYLLSDDVQDRLTEIGMFSVNGKSLYSEDELFSCVENDTVSYSVNVFYDKGKINDIFNESSSAIKGNEQALNNLKKMTEI